MSDRCRGFALAAALFALALLGTLAAAGFAGALGEWRSGGAALESVVATAAARTGLAAALAGWDVRWSGELRPGEARDLGTGVVPGGTWRAQAHRLSDDLVLIQSAGRSVMGSGRRELGLVAAFRRLSPFPPAAVRVRAVLPPAIATSISGADTPPAGWACPPAADTLPAVIDADSTSTEDAFFGLGGLPWPEVVAWATAVPPGGDSLRVRFEAGNLELAGERLTGTLLVDGDLLMRAGARVVGTAVVRGEVVVGAGGGEVAGSLVARSIRLVPEAAPGSLRVGYSGCAVAAAGRARAPVEAVPGASRLPLW